MKQTKGLNIEIKLKGKKYLITSDSYQYILAEQTDKVKNANAKYFVKLENLLMELYNLGIKKTYVKTFAELLQTARETQNEIRKVLELIKTS